MSFLSGTDCESCDTTSTVQLSNESSDLTLSGLDLSEALDENIYENNIEVIVNIQFKSEVTQCPPWFDKRSQYYQERNPVRKTIKRSNKLVKSSNLPIISVSNLHSLMPKVRNFTLDMQERQIGCGLLSEVWEKKNKKKHKYEIERMLYMEGLKYISTPRPSAKRGGGAAIVAPIDKFLLEKLDIEIPNKLEVCWGMLRPKLSDNAMIKEIIVVSFYSPPKSNKKSKLIDHILTTTHILLTKYPAAGLIIGGDKNDLNIAPLIAGIPRVQQIVNSNTINGKILDIIITNMYQLYQVPVVVPPVLPDDPSIGVPSDHSVPIATPLCSSNPTPRLKYEVKVVQPMPQSGIHEFGKWITQEKWESLETNKTGCVSGQLGPCEQVQNLEKILTEKMDEIFPKLEIKLRPFDKPFITRELKILDRRKKREYLKKGKSENYMKLKKKFDCKFKKAAANYLEKNVRNLKEADPSKAYSTLKKMGSQPGDCIEEGQFTLLSHIEEKLTPEQSVEKIAQHFAQISQNYPPLDIDSLPEDIRKKFTDPIKLPDIPIITPLQVYEKMKKSKKSKSTVPGDLPKSLIQEFSPELAEPLATIFQNIVKSSEWPSSWKTEHGLPLKKVKVPKIEDELRIISLTNYFSKVLEQFVMDWLLYYVGDKIDVGQFGGIKGSSISHYLIEFTNFVLYNHDLKNPHL